jgi:hypothetical protein
MTSASYEELLLTRTVACPICKAEVGAPCTIVGGEMGTMGGKRGDIIIDSYHNGRWAQLEKEHGVR